MCMVFHVFLISPVLNKRVMRAASCAKHRNAHHHHHHHHQRHAGYRRNCFQPAEGADGIGL